MSKQNLSVEELTVLDKFQLDDEQTLRQTLYTDDSLKQYLQDIKQFKVLNSDEEKALMCRCKENDSVAINQFIQHNLRLVVSVVRRYANVEVELLDLIQEGNLSLITAVQNFNPSLGFKFSTYATYYIKRAAIRYIQNNGKAVRLPAYLQQIRHKLAKVTQSYMQTYDHAPTVEELSRLTSIAVEKIVELQLYVDDIISTDAQMYVDNENLTVGDTIQSTDNVEAVVNDRLLMELLDSQIQQLDAREKFVLACRYELYGCDLHNYESIGKKLKLSKERVRQIELKALRRLRQCQS